MNKSTTETPFSIRRYEGISNPSGAVALESEHFIVADDEDNSLRIYHKKLTDQPLQTITLTDLFGDQIKNGKGMEIDLEGATELDGRLFWIGSHSASREGKLRPARHRLLAIQVTRQADGQFTAKAEGSIFKKLIDNLAQDPRFESYQFDKARKMPPKALGALSIEGLAATPERGLLIGFRNPLCGGNIKRDRLVDGEALLVNLLNPFDVIAGKTPSFGDPIELDLGGLGIRDIVLRKKHKYLIVAGPYHENEDDEDHKKESTQLYSWSAKTGKLKRLKNINLDDLNIEAAFFYSGNNKQIQLLSDDGKLGATHGFRSLWLKL